MSQAGLVSVAGGGGATTFVENAGSAIPAAGILNVLGGAGITTSGSGSTVTITATSAGFTWHNQTADLNPIVKENGYFANKAAGRLALTLPVGATMGDTIAVAGFGANGWQLNAGVGQTIELGIAATTVAGSLASTAQFDQLEVVCSPTTTTWIARYVIGNLTVA